MLKTRVLIYVSGGSVLSIETPDDPYSLEVIIEDADDKTTFLAGIAPLHEEEWKMYLDKLPEEDK